MIKKILALTFAVVLSAALFAGCTSNSYKDGAYKAEYNDFDSHGWKDYVEVTIKDGKISEVNYDSVNKDGVKKSEDKGYREAMEPVSKTYPEKFYAELENKLVEAQDPEKVDTVAGATTSSKDFKALTKELLKTNAKKGKTETLVITKAAESK